MEIRKIVKTCDSCKKPRLLMVSGKTSDCFSMCEVNRLGRDDFHGYVPDKLNISDGSGDYIEFTFCLDCGKIQGKFPIDQFVVEASFRGE